jgi:HEPN domain-containing protein
MSVNKQRHEAGRWLQTAKEDLDAAKVLKDAGKHAQACFFAQQSGEKALKAMWYVADQDPWGHSIQRLVSDFPDPEVFDKLDDWLMRAAGLDRYYIPTRYPNGLPDLTPGQSYFPQDSEQAIEQATFFVNLSERFIHSP